MVANRDASFDDIKKEEINDKRCMYASYIHFIGRIELRSAYKLFQLFTILNQPLIDMMLSLGSILIDGLGPF